MGEHPSERKYLRAGASVLLHAYDPELKERVYVFVEKGDAYMENGNSGPGFSLPGGYVNIECDEQSPGAAFRELNEELLDNAGKTLLPQLTPNRLKPLEHMITYSLRKADPNQAGIQVELFELELTAHELSLLKKHHELCLHDRSYSDMAHEHTDREVRAIHLVPASQLGAYAKYLTHHQEREGVKRFYNAMMKKDNGLGV